MARLAERVLQGSKARARGSENGRGSKELPVASIPHLHGVSHRVKKAGFIYGCNVLFSAGNRFGSICAAVERKVEGEEQGKGVCKVKHRAGS